jgi:hypothetical protein
MNLKYLYVLVSGEADYYFEQLLLSLTSLRHRMPDAFVSLLVDNKTDDSLRNSYVNIHELINEYKVVKLLDELSAKERSRWLKTTMRHHVDGDFLYIDCDTIIVGDLSDITELEFDLAAVLDLHYCINEYPIREWIYENDKILGFVSSMQTQKYINSGVIFCRDTPLNHKFFTEWHKLWLFSMSKNIPLDQPSFNQANYTLGTIIHELDGIWNCQLGEVTMLQYISNAKIVHYFASNCKYAHPYLFADVAVYQSIKEKGCVPQELQEKLHHPVTFDAVKHLIFHVNSIDKFMFRNIKNREGIGLRFILKCFWARLLRDLGVRD